MLSWRRHIGTKFVAVVVIVLSATTTGAAILQAVWETDEIVRQRQDAVRHMAHIAGVALTDAVLGFDYVLLDRYVAELIRLADIDYVVVRGA